MTYTEMSALYRTIGRAKKCTFIFCADNGVAKMNVSAYPQKTTASMVKNYLVDKGGAANAFAKFANSELVVVDVGVDADISNLPDLVDRKIDRGTKNIAEGPAMIRLKAERSIQIGKELTEKAIKAGCNCFLIGEMGIGNTTVASAITAKFFDASPRKVTGRGSNISDEVYRNKLKVIRKILQVNDPDINDGIDILSKMGGFEFGAMAGVILAAAKHDCIVILDGFNSAVAALIAYLIDPSVKDILIASHVGREPGHMPILKYLGLPPMFTLDLALGEAIGSSIAARILDRIVYINICGPDADFDGDLDDFKDEDEQEIIGRMLEQLNLDDIAGIENFEDMDNYLAEKFGGEISVEEVELDFQISDDERLEKFIPPFSVNDFNIPRSYPMLVRSMVNSAEETIKATDKTFDFYLKTMPKLHLKAMERCRERFDNLTKPRKSLGLLEDIAIQIAGITNEALPTNSLRHAALAFTNVENTPSESDKTYKPQRRGARRNVSMDFSMTTRTFAMKVFMSIVDPDADPTVAFNFGRNIAEEISFSTPIIALTELSDWNFDKLDEKFAKALIKRNGDLKVPPESFLSVVPKKFRCLTSAVIGAIIAAAHNSTLIVIDCGAVEIIARYLEEMCPEIRPFLLHATQLVNYPFPPGQRIGFDGEIACIGVEIAEAALSALNDMKTFDETKVDSAIDN